MTPTPEIDSQQSGEGMETQGDPIVNAICDGLHTRLQEMIEGKMTGKHVEDGVCHTGVNYIVHDVPFDDVDARVPYPHADHISVDELRALPEDAFPRVIQVVLNLTAKQQKDFQSRSSSMIGHSILATGKTADGDIQCYEKYAYSAKVKSVTLATILKQYDAYSQENGSSYYLRQYAPQDATDWDWGNPLDGLVSRRDR